MDNPSWGIEKPEDALRSYSRGRSLVSSRLRAKVAWDELQARMWVTTNQSCFSPTTTQSYAQTTLTVSLSTETSIPASLPKADRRYNLNPLPFAPSTLGLVVRLFLMGEPEYTTVSAEGSS